MGLSKKIDFAVVFRVRNANPNGDPLGGNRPRVTYEGLGEVSDVCLKRKIRDRLMENGHPIFVQSDDRKLDDHPSLRARAEAVLDLRADRKDVTSKACSTWFDVRAFGQIFAYKGTSEAPSRARRRSAQSRANATAAPTAEGSAGAADDSGVSIPIRGPVSVHPAFSVSPVSITSTQITKSVSGEGGETKRASDTMGMKHRVDWGVYCFCGSMNPQLAQRTGFSDEDAAAVKAVLPRLFENDASSARPEGSMEVLKVVWWEHNCRSGQCSSAKVHRSLKVADTDDLTKVISFEAGTGPDDAAGDWPRPQVIEGA